MLRRTLFLTLAAVAPMAACADAEKEPETKMAAAPAAALPPFQQDIDSARVKVTLPGSWQYGYSIVDKPDTTFGAYRAFEFHYTADTAAKVPPRLLLVIRAYKTAAWEKIRTSHVGKSAEFARHGGDAYTYSIVTSNPYPTGSPSALRVDQMMLELIGETSPFKLTFK